MKEERKTLLPEIEMLQRRVMAQALKKGVTISAAESCTGGLIGAALTELPGSSAFFSGSAVTYSNFAKTAILSVPSRVIEERGAVSEECALAMADGAQRIYDTDYAVSVTGVAGPDGGSPEKPVGTVWFGVCGRRKCRAFKRLFPGDRDTVRNSTVVVALKLLLEEMEVRP